MEMTQDPRFLALLCSGAFCSFLAGLIWGRNQVYCLCCSAINWFYLVQQSRQQMIRAYCPHMYTVATCLNDKDPARSVNLKNGQRNSIFVLKKNTFLLF